MKTGQLQTTVTIGDVLAQNRGLGPGFDFLRVALALSIVAWHSPPVANGAKWLDFTPIVWFPGYGMLVMFFGLSGFLIAGSAQRLKIHDFLINRGLRIFPALILEITLSALVLGPLFTNLTESEYFQNGLTYAYFLNVFGFMHYKLPGVFWSNPSNLVNWSLWTVPYELGCYAIMSFFIIYGMLKKPSILLIMVAVYTLIGVAVARLYLDDDTAVGAISNSLLTGRGSRLFVAFVLGIAAYLYRTRISYDRRLFALSVAVCFAVSLITPSGWLSQPLLNSVLCVPLVYMMTFIGCTRMPKLLIYGTGDYSYGIYLYGLPIQQAVRAIFPGLTGGAANFAVSVIGITAFAAFSWFCVERPILRMRKRFSFVARARGVEGPGESKVGAPPPITDKATGEILSFGSEQRQSG
jgi:peptidoglycan/LPS O-acetylase OafA/YrhL